MKKIIILTGAAAAAIIVSIVIVLMIEGDKKAKESLARIEAESQAVLDETDKLMRQIDEANKELGEIKYLAELAEAEYISDLPEKALDDFKAMLNEIFSLDNLAVRDISFEDNNITVSVDMGSPFSEESSSSDNLRMLGLIGKFYYDVGEKGLKLKSLARVNNAAVVFYFSDGKVMKAASRPVDVLDLYIQEIAPEKFLKDCVTVEDLSAK